MSDPAQGGVPGSGAPVADIPFSPEDERRIVGMSRFMTIAGVLAAITAVLQLVASALRLLGYGPVARTAAELAARTPGNRVGNLVGTVIGAIVAGFLSLMLLRAGQAFAGMATSSGSDQALLSVGLRRLRAYFLTKSVLILVAIAFVCVALPILMFVAGAVGAAAHH